MAKYWGFLLELFVVCFVCHLSVIIPKYWREEGREEREKEGGVEKERPQLERGEFYLSSQFGGLRPWLVGLIALDLRRYYTS